LNSFFHEYVEEEDLGEGYDYYKRRGTWRWKLLLKLFFFVFVFLNQCMFKFAKVMEIVMIMGKIVYVNTKVVVVGNISRLCFF
jgi:hypothetical protein